jgi:hypothetical protein
VRNDISGEGGSPLKSNICTSRSKTPTKHCAKRTINCQKEAGSIELESPPDRTRETTLPSSRAMRSPTAADFSRAVAAGTFGPIAVPPGGGDRSRTNTPRCIPSASEARRSILRAGSQAGACDKQVSGLKKASLPAGDQTRTSSTRFTGTIRATRFMTFLFCSAFFRS